MALDSFLEQACVVLTHDIERLEPLVKKLKESETIWEKHEWISEDPLVVDYLKHPSFLKTFLSGVSLECSFALKSVIAIGQAERVFDAKKLPPDQVVSRLRDILECLLTVEEFYREIGGVVGYHLTMIKFLCRPEELSYGPAASYHPPRMEDISEMTGSVREAIYSCIENMRQLAEIYPVGGAADRLKLHDPDSGCALPAAKLNFCGKTLLERLVSDVQAKEYLYFKLKKEQITLPIAMMTSKEKDNHERILSLCRESQFFHRREDSFFFFCQPSVPTITREGSWGMQGALQPLLRPGGHGVIWKLARDQGCFDWLKKQGVTKALVRQINNPIASEDYGLYAFSGIGLAQDKTIGFCSCPRLVKSAEGMNVLVEEKKGDAYEYTLTNIEYCDFQKYGIADQPEKEESSFSKYPSNTNLLFIDLASIEEALQETPIPGMLVNLKKISYKDEFGHAREEALARLESMMQNIADCFKEASSYAMQQMPLRSYITHNKRSKTISTTKKEYVLGSSLVETPEGCFIDMMHNARELLALCKVTVSDQQLDLKPSFVFLYHPALGPLYSIISQKIRKGRLAAGSELHLYVSELDFSGVEIEGSLRIEAENIMGHIQDGHLFYSTNTGKCVLKNVHVINEGIDYSLPCVFWKTEVQRKQSCHIQLLGDAEFYAENVTLRGDISLVVQHGTRVTAKEENGKLLFIEEKISEPSWYWEYFFDKEKNIVLRKRF